MCSRFNSRDWSWPSADTLPCWVSGAEPTGPQVRLYDAATQKLVCALAADVSDPSTVGHTDRIFALKYAAHDDDTFLSAGWDDTVRLPEILSHCDRGSAEQPSWVSYPAANLCRFWLLPGDLLFTQDDVPVLSERKGPARSPVSSTCSAPP